MTQAAPYDRCVHFRTIPSKTYRRVRPITPAGPSGRAVRNTIGRCGSGSTASLPMSGTNQWAFLRAPPFPLSCPSCTRLHYFTTCFTTCKAGPLHHSACMLMTGSSLLADPPGKMSLTPCAPTTPSATTGFTGLDCQRNLTRRN